MEIIFSRFKNVNSTICLSIKNYTSCYISEKWFNILLHVWNDWSFLFASVFLEAYHNKVTYNTLVLYLFFYMHDSVKETPK